MKSVRNRIRNRTRNRTHQRMSEFAERIAVRNAVRNAPPPKGGGMRISYAYGGRKRQAGQGFIRDSAYETRYFRKQAISYAISY